MGNIALEQAASTVKDLQGILDGTVTLRLWDIVERPALPTSEQVEASITETLRKHVSANATVSVMASKSDPGKWRVSAGVGDLLGKALSDQWLAETDIPRRPEAVLVDVVRALLAKAEQHLIETAKQ